jgi:Protein of unknown function (DUF2934)
MKSQRTPRIPDTSPTPNEHSPEALERIRARAYELFDLGGRQEGHDLDDWLQAEAEMTQKKVKTTAA